MSRVRLTKRVAVDAENDVPYSGNVNQPDRKDKKPDQYDTFEHTVNYELPDLRHEWKKDSRDEMHIPMPTVASIRAAASNAVKLAVLFLGDKVAEDVIEAQARDFMKMGSDSLGSALSRFAESEKLYAQEEEKVEEKVEEKKAQEEEKVEEKKEEKTAKELPPEFLEQQKKMKEKAEDKKEEKTAAAADGRGEGEDKGQSAPASSDAAVKEKKAQEEEKVEEKVEEKKAQEEEKVEEKVEEKKAQEEEKVEEVEEEAEEKKAGMAELDIELTTASDDGEENSEEDDTLLANLYAQEEEEEVEEKKEAKAKKAGIAKLGGQPKQAATGSTSFDIGSIWDSAPDVSELFK